MCETLIVLFMIFHVKKGKGVFEESEIINYEIKQSS